MDRRLGSVFAKQRTGLLLSVLAAAFLVAPYQSCAQAEEGVTVVAGYLAGKKVSQVINDLRNQAQTLIDSGTSTGHALMTRAGNEGNVLAANTAFQLSGLLDKTFDQLNEQQKQILIEAEAYRRQISKVTNTAYEIKDTTVIDLNQIADRLPFVNKTLFIQAIRGDAFLPTVGDFDIFIYAPIGVQTDEVDHVEILRNGSTLPVTRVDMTTQRGVAHVVIPNSALASNFADKTLTVLPVTVRLSADRKQPWNIFQPVKHLAIEAPVYIAFYPRLAATLSIAAKAATYDWRQVDIKRTSITTPNRNCTHKCHGEPTRGPNHLEFAVKGGSPPPMVGYQRLVSPQVNCVSGNCGWRSEFITRLSDNDTRAYSDWDTWSTPGTYELSATVQQYETVGERQLPPIGPIDLNFGQLTEIVLPKDRTDAIVDVITFTKKHYQLILGQPDATVIYKSASDASVDVNGLPLQRIVFTAGDPAT